MGPSGGGDETDGRGVGPGVDGGGGAGAGQNLGVEAGIRKRKASVLSRDSNNLAGNGGLEVECVDSLRIRMEIETLRSQLDGDEKELAYCEENEKLRIEIDMKDKEMKCLRKQIEELQTKYNKQNQKLQAKYEKKNEELESMYKKKKEELQAKYDKQTEQLQAKHERHQKNIVQILKNQIDAKRKQLRQLEGLYSTVEFALTQLEEKSIPDKSCDEDSNFKLVDKSSAQKSVVDGKAADEELKRLEMEVARLDTEIQIKMEKLGDTNAELQEIQGKLIAGMEDELNGRTALGFKRIGELDEKPFLNVCKRRYGNDDYLTKAAELIKNWQEEIKNPTWHPFKMVTQADGANKEVINDDDRKLKYLCTEFGVDVCNAVKTALMQVNEPVLWNLTKGREATMMEGINTRGFLRRRNTHLDSYTCELCILQSEETLQHLFLECNFARACWETIGVNYPRNIQPLQALEHIKGKLNVPFSMEVMVVMAWSIWTTRNGWIFNGIDPTVQGCKAKFVQEFSLMLHRAKK